MAEERERGALSLLTRHFLRRLIDNDLISPRGDRHQSLALLASIVGSAAIFVTMFQCVKYLADFTQLPGSTALSALSDRFLFISASMTITALATLLVWDALGLEPRDAAILGPLPIPVGTIMGAKLAALLLFAGGFTLALNAVPSVLYPSFLLFNLRGVSGGGVLRAMWAHAVVVISAGLCSFFAILAFRGTLQMALGGSAFRRVSTLAQGALVVSCFSALLLAPTMESRLFSPAPESAALFRWLGGRTPTPAYARPVLWYLGLGEGIAGDIIVDAPLVLISGLPVRPGLRRDDERAKAEYRALAPELADLGRSAILALIVATGVAIMTFLWNNRRLPAPPRDRSARGGVRFLLPVAARLTAGDSEAQAGFFFTLQALAGSAPHRLILAISIAAAATVPLAMFAGASALLRVDLSSAPLALIAMQYLVIACLVAGFRHAVAVPAELAANWIIETAWLCDERRYLGGVKRAGVVVISLLSVVVLLPLHVLMLGPGIAFVHASVGVLVLLALMEAVFLGYRRMPFVCSYVPFENPNMVWPLAVAAGVLGAFSLASLERWALGRAPSAIGLLAALAIAAVVVTRIDRWQRRERLPLDFYEAPALPTQRLGLDAAQIGAQE